jgi:ankyrin repeat protein
VAAKSDLNKLDNAGWAPLHLAILKGNLAIVEVMSTGGADVNRKSKFGKTPLDVARARNDTAIVQFLQQRTGKRGGRGLIDGGLGVSDAMEGM